MKLILFVFSVVLSFTPSLSFAQQPKGDTGPASQAFNGVNSRMHQGMDIVFSGNVDADYAKAMISVHQGAIDMARTAIAFGKDAELKKLAETTIRGEEAALAALQAWISRQPKQAP